jgi:hypothetical protein
MMTKATFLRYVLPKLSVAARASAERLTSGIQNLILDKLLKLIP